MDPSGAGEPVSDLEVADRLIREFGGRLPARTIQLVARQEIALFDRAQDRSRVAPVAWRLARGRLQEMLPANRRGGRIAS